jgi:hypothetical protein
VSTTSSEFTASGCSAPVAPGSSCLVTVAFVGNRAVGDRTATLNIASNAANNPNMSVALSASITGAATQVIDNTQAPAPAPAPAATVIQRIEVLGATASQRVQPRASSALAVSGLSLSRRVSVTRLRAQGLGVSMRLKPGTKTVRMAIYRTRNGKRTGRAVFTATRTARAAGLYRTTLRGRTLTRALKPGAYVMEVRAGRSASSLSAVRRFAFTVTR